MSLNVVNCNYYISDIWNCGGISDDDDAVMTKKRLNEFIIILGKSYQIKISRLGILEYATQKKIL